MTYKVKLVSVVWNMAIWWLCWWGAVWYYEFNKRPVLNGIWLYGSDSYTMYKYDRVSTFLFTHKKNWAKTNDWGKGNLKFIFKSRCVLAALENLSHLIIFRNEFNNDSLHSITQDLHKSAIMLAKQFKAFCKWTFQKKKWYSVSRE